MKSFLPSRVCLLAVTTAAAWWLSAPSQAFPPAPNHFIFGQVRDEYGQPLSLANAQIIFQTDDSVEVATALDPTLAPGVNYRLSLPMDSGTIPDLYKPTALLPAVPFRIRVKIGLVTYLPMEMVASFANLGKPAQSTRIDLTLGVDADGDGLPDAWQQLLRTLLGPDALIGPDQDADGDGINNLLEYLAGTYAFDPEDGFRLKLLIDEGGTSQLEFMVVPPRTYTIYSSTDLQDWTPMEFRLPEDAPDAATRRDYRATDIQTLKVEPVYPPGSPATAYFFKVQAQ